MRSDVDSGAKVGQCGAKQNFPDVLGKRRGKLRLPAESLAEPQRIARRRKVDHDTQ
jgi:hypothetical protein